MATLAPDETPKLRGIRFRALLIGFLLCLPVCYAASNAESTSSFVSASDVIPFNRTA